MNAIVQFDFKNASEYLMKPIFILGCDRSGTTITKRVISKSLGINPLGYEPRLLVDGDLKKGILTSVWRAFGEDDAESTKNWIMRQFDIDERRGWKQFFEKKEFLSLIDSVVGELKVSEKPEITINRFVKSIHRLRCDRVGQNSLYFIDDTPANCLVVNELIETFPDAKVIHCIRDGREVVKSIKEKGWWSSDERVILNRWLSIVRNGRSMGKIWPRENYKEVIFNNVKADPEAVYKDVINWIDDSASLNLANFDVSRERIVDRGWKLEGYYKTVAADLIAEFGWE